MIDSSPDRARWSYILDRMTILTVIALATIGTFLISQTANPFWGFATFLPALAMIGIAALLRIIARPQPWRAMKLILLALNLLTWAGIIALASGTAFLRQYLSG